MMHPQNVTQIESMQTTPAQTPIAKEMHRFFPLRPSMCKTFRENTIACLEIHKPQNYHATGTKNLTHLKMGALISTVIEFLPYNLKPHFEIIKAKISIIWVFKRKQRCQVIPFL